MKKAPLERIIRLSLIGIYFAIILVLAFGIDILFSNFMLSFALSIFIISTLFYWVRYYDTGRGLLIFFVFLGACFFFLTFDIVLSLFINSVLVFLLFAYKILHF